MSKVFYTQIEKNNEGDVEIYEKEIQELVEIELDTTCHDDLIEDYNSELEFYLSNVKNEDYVTHFLPGKLDDKVRLYEETKEIIQAEVISRIKQKLEG